LKDGLDDYGKLWAACITDDALVAVYANGFKLLGNVPSDLETSLRQTSINVYRLKIAGSAWFYADTDGNGKYNL